MGGTHALLSPSAAHRWLNCTAAPQLEKGEPNKETPYTAEGTLAHAYCAKALKGYLNKDTSHEDEEIQAYDSYDTEGMGEHVDTYVGFVLGKYLAARKKTKDATLLVETRLDFSEYVPKAFGTADAIIVADGTLEVVDLKYGKGVAVDAKENPQMMIYALGAYELFSVEYNIQHVRMTIVQPRLGNISEYELSPRDLLEWANATLKPKAKEAYGKDGKQSAGAWCRFCKVKAKCKALKDYAQDALTQRDPKLLTKQEIEATLPKIDTLKNWLSSFEEYTLEEALKGKQFKGFKLVEGRSIRKITSPESVKQELEALGYTEADYIRPKELKSLTDLEKLVGKKNFTAACGEYIDKPRGKPTLVPESDKRPPINTATSDFEEVEC